MPLDSLAASDLLLDSEPDAAAWLVLLDVVLAGALCAVRVRRLLALLLRVMLLLVVTGAAGAVVAAEVAGLRL